MLNLFQEFRQMKGSLRVLVLLELALGLLQLFGHQTGLAAFLLQLFDLLLQRQHLLVQRHHHGDLLLLFGQFHLQLLQFFDRCLVCVVLLALLRQVLVSPANVEVYTTLRRVRLVPIEGVKVVVEACQDFLKGLLSPLQRFPFPDLVSVLFEVLFLFTDLEILDFLRLQSRTRFSSVT